MPEDPTCTSSGEGELYPNLHPEIQDVVKLLRVWHKPETAAQLPRYADYLEDLKNEVPIKRVILALEAGKGNSWAIQQVPGLKEEILHSLPLLALPATEGGPLLRDYVLTTNESLVALSNWAKVHTTPKTLVILNVETTGHAPVNKIHYFFLNSEMSTGLFPSTAEEALFWCSLTE